MKITKTQLREIIREELLNEDTDKQLVAKMGSQVKALGSALKLIEKDVKKGERAKAGDIRAVKIYLNDMLEYLEKL